MKLFMPKQHGAWAMLIIPFWLSVVSATFIWQHIPFFIGFLFLYLATYPMLLLFRGKKIAFHRKWTLIYLIPAILLLLIPLWTRPSIIIFALVLIPLFIINSYYSKTNNERALLNDFSAIIEFAVVGMAAAYLPTGHIGAATILVAIASVLFFGGSTFYVKSMIREKKNIRYKWISWAYHLIVPTIFVIAGYWVVALAFIPSLLRAILLYGTKITTKQLGIGEIINATIFFIIIVIAIV